ncbi:MAG TPA: hypothetical protein VFF90_13685, partial [Saprospiraceae bacterium]|nr:hypothetical protein [Saprospiraceae bacterium]
MPLSKSSFKSYLQCPSYFWFSQNKPGVLAPSALSDFEQMLADQGKLVEKEFYKLFPDAEFVVSKGQASLDETRTKITSG